jgi:hypothetical protein
MNQPADRRRRWVVGGMKLLLLTVLAALLAASAPSSPDDWGGLGFLDSIEHFDMDRFAPHPPGYPVYVMALRLAHVLTVPSLAAAHAVAIASAVSTAHLAFAAAARLWGPRSGLLVATAVVATPLAWRSMSAVGTEALALTFAALGLWSLVVMHDTRKRWTPFVLGTAVGLGLCVRLSWAPLFVSMLFVASRGTRVRALLVAGVSTAAWALPLVVVVGPAHLVQLYEAHAQGHASRWGGTAITEPGASRLLYLARDIFVDGLGAGPDALGIAISAVAAALAVAGIVVWRRSSWRRARTIAVLLVPYAVWITVGQNLRQQPRHALPLVVAFAAALALTASRTSRLQGLGAALALLVGTRTAFDAKDRRALPPPGQQLVAFVARLPDPASERGAGAHRRGGNERQGRPPRRPRQRLRAGAVVGEEAERVRRRRALPFSVSRGTQRRLPSSCNMAAAHSRAAVRR